MRRFERAPPNLAPPPRGATGESLGENLDFEFIISIIKRFGGFDTSGSSLLCVRAPLWCSSYYARDLCSSMWADRPNTPSFQC